MITVNNSSTVDARAVNVAVYSDDMGGTRCAVYALPLPLGGTYQTFTYINDPTSAIERALLLNEEPGRAGVVIHSDHSAEAAAAVAQILRDGASAD